MDGSRGWSLDQHFFLRSYSLQWEMERTEARIKAICFNQCYNIEYYFTCMFVHHYLILKMKLLGQRICIYRNVVHTTT